MNSGSFKAKLFCGTTSSVLAAKVASALHTTVGKIEVDTFSDGEIRVEVNESVRGDRVIIIQSTCSSCEYSTNDSLMELLIIVDALRRSAAKEIIAVVPYYGYARQDRRPGFSRTPISSRLVADMIETAGVNQLITLDLHSLQQVGFFHIPVTNISASPILVGDIWKHYGGPNMTIISPDIGGVARARAVAKDLSADLAIIDKRRSGPNQAEVMNIIGNVEGRDCIMLDDMIDTAGTLTSGANRLRDFGAKSVVAYASHGVLSGKAYENIKKSFLKEVVVTDTVPSPLIDPTLNRIRILSIGAILAETIQRILEGNSVSEIYVGH